MSSSYCWLYAYMRTELGQPTLIANPLIFPRVSKHQATACLLGSYPQRRQYICSQKSKFYHFNNEIITSNHGQHFPKYKIDIILQVNYTAK